jgi:nucleoside-diphosphate-sugar epimerase
VDDTATGIVQATLSQSATNGTFNITRGVGHTLEEAASCIKEICGSDSTIELLGRDPNFPSRGSLSIQAARQVFGYTPVVDIEVGFKRYIDWVKASTYWKKHL